MQRRPVISALAAAALIWAASPSVAQDPIQLCVNQCRFPHGSAGSARHDACIRQICEAAAPSASGWTVQSRPGQGARTAAVMAQARSFNVICQRGKALMAVAVIGGGGQGLTLRVDRQQFALVFVVRNGILYAEGTRPILSQLRAGSRVQVMQGQVTQVRLIRGHRSGA